MTSQGRADFSPQSFSTRMIDPASRLEFWHEVFGRQGAKLNIEPQDRDHFAADATLRVLPSLRVGQFRSTAAVSMRTKELIADGDDTVALLCGRAKTFTVLQFGRECHVSPANCVLLRNDEPARLEHKDVAYQGIVLSRSLLGMRERDVERVYLTRLNKRSPALRMLLDYSNLLRRWPALGRSDTADAVTRHFHELFGLVLIETISGTTSHLDGEVARVNAIEAFIKGMVGRDDVTLDAVATRYGLSPRYIQKLFSQKGTTFTAFKLEHHLCRARDFLGEPACKSWTIIAIALAAGFGDLSYFNRAFRRRFGCTPTEMRDASGDQAA